ncbi:MAG: 2-oxoacid:acceptor oxidoreductase family protein [Promethearchaeota archaeon]
MTFNILVCGVGGQGVMAFSRLLCTTGYLDEKVYDVVGSETRGVAQREGVVSATVRWITSPSVPRVSPKIPRGRTHLVLSLEEVETFRYAGLYNPSTVVLYDARRILPKTVEVGITVDYPQSDELSARLRGALEGAFRVPGARMSKEHFGDYRQAGIILFSSLYASGSPLTPPVDLSNFREAIRRQFANNPDPLRAVEVGLSFEWPGTR